MKKHAVLNCAVRRDGQYQVIIRDVGGGHTMRAVVSDRPVKVGTDVMVSSDKVIHS
jgi:hypothetical protein